MRMPLLAHNQRYPVVDHYGIDQSQTDVEEGLLCFVTALFYDATGDEQGTWGEHLREVGSNRADDTRYDICEHQVELSCHARCFGFIQYAQDDGDALAQAIGCNVGGCAFDSYADIVDAI